MKSDHELSSEEKIDLINKKICSMIDLADLSRHSSKNEDKSFRKEFFEKLIEQDIFKV